MDPRYDTDWAAIIDALQRQGLAFSRLSRCTGIPRATLHRFSDGAIPKHADGEALLAFWCSFTVSTREQAPITPRLLNANARRQA
jgi:lambda repressor-like predicted transcriptional regulator